MSAGKGDTPRNVGPKFRANYGRIRWGKRGKQVTRKSIRKP
jgi:hypothetical protein